MSERTEGRGSPIHGEWIVYVVAAAAVILGGAVRSGAFPARTTIDGGSYSLSIPLAIGQGEGEGGYESGGIAVSVLRSWDLGLVSPGLPSLELRRLTSPATGPVSFSGAALAERAGEPGLQYYDRESVQPFAGGIKIAYAGVVLEGRSAVKVHGTNYVFPTPGGAYMLAFKGSGGDRAEAGRVMDAIARSFAFEGRQQ